MAFERVAVSQRFAMTSHFDDGRTRSSQGEVHRPSMEHALLIAAAATPSGAVDRGRLATRIQVDACNLRARRVSCRYRVPAHAPRWFAASAAAVASDPGGDPRRSVSSTASSRRDTSCLVPRPKPVRVGPRSMNDTVISVDDIEAAERLLGIAYTLRERRQMAGNVEGQIASAQARRAVVLPNTVPMASRFDPRLPTFRMPAPGRPCVLQRGPATRAAGRRRRHRLRAGHAALRLDRRAAR